MGQQSSRAELTGNRDQRYLFHEFKSGDAPYNGFQRHYESEILVTDDGLGSLDSLVEELAQRHGLSTDILSRVAESTAAGHSGYTRQQFSLESLTKLPTAQDPKTYVNTTAVDAFRFGASALEVRERLGDELGPPAPAHLLRAQQCRQKSPLSPRRR